MKDVRIYQRVYGEICNPSTWVIINIIKEIIALESKAVNNLAKQYGLNSYQ